MTSLSRARAGDGAPLQRAGESYAAQFAIWIAGLTALRLAGNAFANTDLFFDEAQYWFWSRELAFGYYPKPPLIGWIIRAATEICGSSEACIRAPSALFHAATAAVILLIGRRLYDFRAGFWAGLTYATLPGVSLSSSLISTDVPLLFFVAVALFALVKLRDGGGWGWAVVLGGAIGFGLMSKYAMAYFVLCLAGALIWIPGLRPLLRDARLYAALAIGAALITPNIVWNAHNGFATFSHTADNANWGGPTVKPLKALEFFGGQFGVFGPILFAALVAFCVNWLRSAELREAEGDRARLLMAFSLPVIGLMMAQAFLSRAHANWAAFAYVSATVLIAAVLLRGGYTRLLRLSLAIHLAIALLIPAGGLLAGKVSLPGGADPDSRVLGWRDLARAVDEKADAGGFRAIATDTRALTAELLCYLRDGSIPVVSYRSDAPPSDHFELTRPLTDETPRPVLLVSYFASGPDGASLLGAVTVDAGLSVTRTIYFFELDEVE